MKEELKLFILIILLMGFVVFINLTGNLPKVLADANTTNQTNVTVYISTLTEITVVPRNLTWYNVLPGVPGGIKYLQIRNTGTMNISKVYLHADTLTTEPNNPLPSGIPSPYSSGGVLVVKRNDTPYAPDVLYPYYYVDRLEWNTSLITPNSRGPAGSIADGADLPITWGYYRNATPGSEYLFYLVNGSTINNTNGCNSTNSKIMIETEADQGEPSTRNPATGGTVTQTLPDWGIYNFTSGPLAGNCVAIYRTCEKILIYRYDRRDSGSTQFNKCDMTNDEQSIKTNNFVPGEEFQIDFDAWVPEGIPGGGMTPTWLTVEAGS